jgi:fructose-1,6-bisphosphatase/sedoheptulose 1,7-bisphosphatase-like protein
VGFHIGGKPEGVIARALFRQLGVAFLERLDDSHMLGQRYRSAILASDRQLPVAANVQQDIIGHIDQHRRLAERNQRLMKGDVGLRIFLDVILGQAIFAEILEEIPQIGD